ncbi:APC family permease [Granulicella tundricola]|uniref:Amino acid permease-associated region n=1 Tax=Granulicella tundricola (strain ATCC BAA-1859 / DSM 23138 / MP5ACTX9) TaxID=1198114 RepID=E8WX76_GRATM|nr:APC family permease [Granulicella tundricola]ADW69718.1 amino acid permease-associated region [Granulicella tundricola MP5ACTX9]
MDPVAPANHELKRELRLWDLVPMQILLVVGITWAGIAARQGGTHVFFWVVAVLTLFIPTAAVVMFCVRLWPEEGGVYSWTRNAFGPFAGFMSGWNFALWALLTVSNIGIITATSLSYGLGPSAAWMTDSHALVVWLSAGLFGLILIINLFGFGIGKWVSHFGTAVMVLVTFLLILLLFFHPHATAAHPHVSPQKPFLFGLPLLTLLSLNLFSKISFNALTGLEQVAVFAGETKDPARAILRSAWIAAPLIVLIYVLMTGSILTYIPMDQVDLTGPVPQILSAAFSGGSSSGLDVGLLLGRGAILALAVALVAQYAVIVAETSRLPLVAGWDGILPAWFTRLHPRWGTPTRAIVVIVGASMVAALLATSGAGKQEAFQLIVTSGNLLYGVYYLMMFAIPLFVGARFWMKVAAVSGFLVSLLAMGFNLVPIVAVANAWVFAGKVVGAALFLNLVGMGVYWRGTRGRG